ncbi:lipocalin-like domain-containing protein [Pseudozobellia thermophila]|uniref:Lipocalin-like domain-containing protein n=1 Tax=Pseudozobellia thermophila TaxID=192903 RepID=A0A1M6IQ98_9FLAO|nr:lipocalin family protein [Pseudozobellia thermophila]SHJ36585.1 Lipocalin-like domain-containing protein [Pseudozobellia thermophila]
MRNLKLIYVFLSLFIVFSSCNDDDSNSDYASVSIIGKWQLIAENYGGQSQDLSACEKEQTMEFFSDGTVEHYYVDNEPCDFSTANFSYSENDNQLIFSVEGEGVSGGTYVLTSVIEVLDDITLRYRFISDNEDGVYPVSEQTSLTYKRIE